MLYSVITHEKWADHEDVLFFLTKYSIYVYTIHMKRKIVYPDWVEKYRTKGRTIRKVRDGYGLYSCTSVYVKDSAPKSVQKYLGMITEKDGFIPKVAVPENPRFIEYGLSRFLLRNFKRDLQRASFGGLEEIIYLGIVMFMFGSVEPCFVRATFLTYDRADEFITYAEKVNISRVKSLVTRIEKILVKKIPDEKERNTLIRLLFLCVVDTENTSRRLPALPEEVTSIIERNGLKYG